MALSRRDDLRVRLWRAFYHGAKPEEWRELARQSAEALDEAERVETHLRLRVGVVSDEDPRLNLKAEL